MKFVVTMPEGPVFETFWSPDERRPVSYTHLRAHETD